MQLSALTGVGVDSFWDQVSEFRKLQTANGRLQLRRKHQAVAWMWERIEAGLRQRFRSHPQVSAKLSAVSREVDDGRMAPSVAARKLLDLFSAGEGA